MGIFHTTLIGRELFSWDLEKIEDKITQTCITLHGSINFINVIYCINQQYLIKGNWSIVYEKCGYAG